MGKVARLPGGGQYGTIVESQKIVAALHAVHPGGPVRLLNDDTCFTFQELAAQSLIGFGVESP